MGKNKEEKREEKNQSQSRSQNQNDTSSNSGASVCDGCPSNDKSYDSSDNGGGWSCD